MENNAKNPLFFYAYMDLHKKSPFDQNLKYIIFFPIAEAGLL